MKVPNRYMPMLSILAIVIVGLSAVKAGSAGDKHSCAVFHDGSVKVKVDPIYILFLILAKRPYRCTRRHSMTMAGTSLNS